MVTNPLDEIGNGGFGLTVRDDLYVEAEMAELVESSFDRGGVSLICISEHAATEKGDASQRHLAP